MNFPFWRVKRHSDLAALNNALDMQFIQRICKEIAKFLELLENWQTLTKEKLIFSTTKKNDITLENFGNFQIVLQYVR